MDVLTRDPAAVARLPWYVGALSNLGAIMWCAAATILIFTGSLRAVRLNRPRDAQFMLHTGGLIALMLCDDLFLVHDHLLPGLFGIHEASMYAAYLVLGGLLSYGHWPRIWSISVFVPIWVGCCLAISIAIDLIDTRLPFFWRFQSIGYEDAFKLLGTAGVLVCSIISARACLVRVEALDGSADL